MARYIALASGPIVPGESPWSSSVLSVENAKSHGLHCKTDPPTETPHQKPQGHHKRLFRLTHSDRSSGAGTLQVYARSARSWTSKKQISKPRIRCGFSWKSASRNSQGQNKARMGLAPPPYTVRTRRFFHRFSVARSRQLAFRAS